MKLLNLTFENTYSKPQIIIIKLNDNNFVDRWIIFLEQFINNPKFKYEITLNGFNQGEEFKNLRKTIKEINLYKQDSIPNTLSNKFEFTMQDLSNLHFIYENIANDTSYLDIQKIVDCLNDNIHHAEEVALKNQSASPRLRFRIVDSNTGVPNFFKKPLKEEDYKLFDPYIEPYVVYLNYNALGEDYLKTFKSGRPADTAVQLDEYSPSFFFTLQADYIKRQHKEIQDCKKWMLNNNIDSSNYKNALGHIPLGRVHKVFPEDFFKDILQRQLTTISIEEIK